MNLRLRLLEVALLPLLLAVGLFAVYFAHRSTSEAERDLLEHGVVASSHLSSAVAFDLFAGNLPAIRHIFEYEAATQQALAIGLVERGRWLVTSGDAQVFAGQRIDPPERYWQARQVRYFSQPMREPALAEADPYLEPETVSSRQAYVVVALSHASVDAVRNQIILAASGVALFTVIVALLLAWRIAAKVSRPLFDLTETVSRLAQGELSHRVAEDAQGEIGQLQQGVNHMAQILEQHRNELRLRIDEATHELVGQKQAAEAAALAKSRFLAAASHDLRQPLHALSLLVAALKERVPDGEAGRLAENIEASAGAMTVLLNTLLDLSKLDAGAVEARPECMQVMRVLEAVEQQFAPLAKEKGLSLRIVPSRMWIYHDPAILMRILANLVGNALRYTDAGGVLVGFRRVQRDWVRLEVWDTGRGIPKEFHERVFEEYFQLENPERHRDKGLGLGLSIVSRLARLLGGRIEVRSQSGRGSCFRLGIPRCPAPTGAREAPPPAPTFTLPQHDALVAFIDDDVTILEAMVEMFDHWGIPLAVGEDADQLLRELEALGQTPSVILSDYRLREGRTGIEAIASLRERYGADLPAALLTGDTASETLAAIAVSGLPTLHKPFKPAKLRAFLSHLLADKSEQDLS